MFRELSESNASDLAATKAWVLSCVRDYQLDAGHILPAGQLSAKAGDLPGRQQDVLFPAISALITEGVFVIERDHLMLTETGHYRIHTGVNADYF